MPIFRPQTAAVLSLLLPFALLTACSVEPPSVSAAKAKELAALDYPATADYGEDWPIVVTRDGDYLVFHYSGTTHIPESRIWINREFVGDLPLLKVGSSTRLSLTRCVNLHREAFPVPQSFLSKDLERKVILVELIDSKTGLKHRVTVRPQPGIDD